MLDLDRRYPHVHFPSPPPTSRSIPPGPATTGTAPVAEAPGPLPCRKLRAGLLPHLERLDDVVDLDVVEATQRDTALEALADLGRIVLEPPQRLDGGVLRHHRAVADDPRLGVAPDETGADQAAGDDADLRGAEHVAHFGAAELRLLVLGLEQPLERGLDLLDGLVDDGVVPHLHALAVGQLTDPLGMPDVEPDDDRVGRARQVDVVLGDRTHAAVNDLELDLVGDVDLDEGVLQSLHRTGHVALDDEGQRGLLAFLHLLEQRLQRRPATRGRHLRRPAAGLPLLGDLADRPVVVGREEVVPAPGTAVRPSTCTGRDGPAVATGSWVSLSMARTRP